MAPCDPSVDIIRPNDATMDEQYFSFSEQHAWIKRIEDLIIGLVLLGLTLPVLGLIALTIALDSGGPVLFAQPRRGHKERPIWVWKFRTMHADTSDVLCVRQSAHNDPRITRLGAFLRRHSLDELPQLLNVIRGDMSIVGPRPHALATSIDGRLLTEVLESYRSRYSVKPGITGWAQVNGLRGHLDTVDKLSKRVEHDLYYIQNWSLWFDVKIIFRTASRIFRDETAY